MMIKVSIVVPTYCTDPDHLNALVASVDGQTLQASEIELVFIDDGSPDGTYARLESIATERPNTVTRQIPNSGWPCRPRNIGTDLARGQYILFMDHDDVLYSQGLEKAYDLASKTNADIVNPKETKTNNWGWGWDIFAQNRSIDNGLGLSALLPMTPHKLYRRDFLIDGNVRFEESGHLMWEDIRFNVLAYTVGAKVAVLGEHPCYHWVAHGKNSSSFYGINLDEKWKQLEGLLQYFLTTVPPGPDLDRLLRHTYRRRFLERMGEWALRARAERVQIEFNYARRMADRYIPESLDWDLSTLDRARSQCLRTGSLEAVRSLAAVEQGVRLGVQVTDVEWRGTALRVSLSVELQTADGRALRLQYDGDRLHRDVDRDIRALLSDDQLDFGAMPDTGVVELGAQARKTREVWHVGGVASMLLADLDSGGHRACGQLITDIDVKNGLYGRAFPKQVFDVSVRAKVLGRVFRRKLPIDVDSLFLCALIEGVSVVAYKNRSGQLTIDVGENIKSIVSMAASAATIVDVVTTKRHSDITLTLTEVHVIGTTRMVGELILNGVAKQSSNAQPIKLRAVLVGAEGKSTISATGDSMPEGTYSIDVRFSGSTTKTEKTISIKQSRPLMHRMKPLRTLPRRVARKYLS